eukprot:7039053-Alexandrium_andersonii.AAC.1
MGSDEPDMPPTAQSSLEPELPPDSMQSTLDSNTTEQTATTVTTADEEIAFEPFLAFESENQDRLDLEQLADITS